MNTKFKHVLSSFVFMSGLFIMALGFVFMIQAKIGVAPWDVLHLGLVSTVGWTVGIWSQLLGLILLVITIVLTRRMMGIGAFLNMFFLGFFIDLIMSWGWIHEASSLVESGLWFVMGLVISCFGTGMYIAPGWGAGPRDGFMLALAERTQWPFRRVRTIMEMAVLVLGWVLGGPVFIGTVIFCLTVGPICQYFIGLWKRILDKAIGRDADYENINQRTLRINHHDGTSRAVR
ncbi:YitT family protein [Ammoniphilus sp. YIM 78166]|uniref:YczE/YyaS/YitT family protein n=1 Tax=Ammoniphilus sp. YIM 78166 TaxID=1644106 RepID=UPI00196A4945|nr:YitT family protein [Ammoniphilus sp. YIM 78166]